MNLAKTIRCYFISVLISTLFVGCSNTDIKTVIINKTIIDNENVIVKFLSKNDNILSFEINNKLNKDISGNMNLTLNGYEIPLEANIECKANAIETVDIPIIARDDFWGNLTQILEKQLDFNVNRGKIEFYLNMTTLEKEVIESPKEWQEKSGQVLSFERDKVLSIGRGYYCFGEKVNDFDEHIIKNLYDDENIRIGLTDIYGFDCACTILIENKTKYYLEIVTEDSILVDGEYPYFSDGRYREQYHQRLLPFSKYYGNIFAKDSPTYNAEVTLKDLSISLYDNNSIAYTINHDDYEYDYDYSNFNFVEKNDLGTITFWVDDYYKKKLSRAIRNNNSVEERLKADDYFLVRNLDNIETVKFGKYEQDGNLQNGKEDIEWLVVTKNEKEALLLSKDILDCKPFSIEKGNMNFENSYLYDWLNSYFYQEAFGDIDKNKTIIKNDIGLLKYDDILKFFDVNENKKENQALGAVGTDYAGTVVDNYEFNVDKLEIMTTLANALQTSDDCWYRNNSPYFIIDRKDSCDLVECDGTIDQCDGTTYWEEKNLNVGVRPAIWVKLMHSSRF